MSPGFSPPPAGLLDRWAEWYPDAPPVGFLLRHADGDRWLRIHSLPESQRYPQSGAEHAEILHRHNAAASDVLGLGRRCALLCYAPCEGRWSGELGRQAGVSHGALPYIGALPAELWAEDDGCFTGPMCLFGVELTWTPGVLDVFVTASATDDVRGLVVCLETGAVYAPYDGGADLFYGSVGERDAARLRFSAWLSPYPSGL